MKMRSKSLRFLSRKSHQSYIPCGANDMPGKRIKERMNRMGQAGRLERGGWGTNIGRKIFYSGFSAIRQRK